MDEEALSKMHRVRVYSTDKDSGSRSEETALYRRQLMPMQGNEDRDSDDNFEDEMDMEAIEEEEFNSRVTFEEMVADAAKEEFSDDNYWDDSDDNEWDYSTPQEPEPYPDPP